MPFDAPLHGAFEPRFQSEAAATLAAMETEAFASGSPQLGDLLRTAGFADMNEVLAIRHTNTSTGLRDVSTVTPSEVLAYTRHQDISYKTFPKVPPRFWLVFMADGSYKGVNRSRLYGMYENKGEVLEERTARNRNFDITLTPALGALKNRLVIDWTTPIKWHRQGALAAKFEVVEIADPQVIPFPSYDSVRLSYQNLQQAVHDPHYKQWQAALRAVKAIYLITDTSNGRHYVGKANGAEGLLGRWTTYADNGHGWNTELVKLPEGQCQHFQFSILRVFEPKTLDTTVNSAESHYKDALLSRAPFGYNAN